MAGDPLEITNKPKSELLMPSAIAKALIDMQKDLKPMIKSATNDLYGSGYVPLEDVADKAFEMLSSRGIGVSQPLCSMPDGTPGIETILFTRSGQGYRRKVKLVLGKQDPQGVLAAVTYFRRGALMTTIGLTAKGEDDDGNKASGVQVPVQEDQINEIKMLLSLMRWTREDIAKAVFALKTKDAAQLAIMRYRDLTSEKMRDEESKLNATAIEVVEEGSLSEVDQSPQETLQGRINKLGLRDKAAENKLVFQITGRPFLSKVTSEENLNELSRAIDALESGKHSLPAEFYALTDEPRTVEEPVA